MNANAQIRNDRLLTVWRDLTTELVWKYEELHPFRLWQLTKLDLLEASDSGFAGAIWFWCPRPKLIFHDGTAPIIVASVIVTLEELIYKYESLRASVFLLSRGPSHCLADSEDSAAWT